MARKTPNSEGVSGKPVGRDAQVSLDHLQAQLAVVTPAFGGLPPGLPVGPVLEQLFALEGEAHRRCCSGRFQRFLQEARKLDLIGKVLAGNLVVL